MARQGVIAVVAFLVVLEVFSSTAAAIHARKLNEEDPLTSPYSGSSPTSGSSPSITIPPVTSTPTAPIVTLPPLTSNPSPVVTIPPVTSSPTGFGSRSGTGTAGFWCKNPGRVPKVLSLLVTLAKIFGPRALKSFGGKLTVLGALKDTSPDGFSSLAREGSASLLNAYAYKDFPLSTTDVLTQFNNALDAPELAAQQAQIFQQYNENV